MRCLGINVKGRRCGNDAALLFCSHHRRQPFVWMLGAATAVGLWAGIFQDLVKPLWEQATQESRESIQEQMISAANSFDWDLVNQMATKYDRRSDLTDTISYFRGRAAMENPGLFQDPEQFFTRVPEDSEWFLKAQTRRVHCANRWPLGSSERESQINAVLRTLSHSHLSEHPYRYYVEALRDYPNQPYTTLTKLIDNFDYRYGLVQLNFEGGMPSFGVDTKDGTGFNIITMVYLPATRFLLSTLEAFAASREGLKSEALSALETARAVLQEMGESRLRENFRLAFKHSKLFDDLLLKLRWCEKQMELMPVRGGREASAGDLNRFGLSINVRPPEGDS